MPQPQRSGHEPAQSSAYESLSGAFPAAGEPPPAPRREEQSVRVRLAGSKAVLHITRSGATELEKNIARVVHKTRQQEKEKGSEAQPRQSYKCVCPRGSLVVFCDPQGKPLQEQSRPLGAIRVKPSSKPGIFYLAAIKDPDGNEIVLPQLAPAHAEEPEEAAAKAWEECDSSQIADWLAEAAPPPKPPPLPKTKPAKQAEDGEMPSPGTGAKMPSRETPGSADSLAAAAAACDAPSLAKQAAARALSASQAANASPRQAKSFDATPEIEDALRQLLQKKRIELAAKQAEKGGGAGKSWVDALLEVADKAAAQPANKGKSLIAQMLTAILDPGKTVPPQRREEVYAFCEEIVKGSRGLALNLGKGAELRKLRVKARPFAENLLAMAGERKGEEDVGIVNKTLTIKDLIARLEPDKPLAVQQRALQQLERAVSEQLQPSNRPKDEGARKEHNSQLRSALETAARSKAFQSLNQRDRRELNGRHSVLRDRINRGAGGGDTKLEKQR
jgi:hypothetical protein